MINFSAVRPNTTLGRIVRFPFRILPKNIFMPVLQGPMKGKLWIVGSHLHGCWLGSYELDTQKRIMKELNCGHVFYDVGANVGYYSILAAGLTHPGLVYAFEPLTTNLAFLYRHLELNNIHNVEVLETAISDRAGFASFEVNTSRAMGRLGESGGVRVRTWTLDALLHDEKIAPPDCIKMDIEGAEFRALLGAKECFTKYRPKLFLATHGSEVHGECCRLLRNWHYEFVYTSVLPNNHFDLFAFPSPIQ